MSDGLWIIGQLPQEPSNIINDAFPCLRCHRGRQSCLVTREIAPAGIYKGINAMTFPIKMSSEDITAECPSW
jgi:hypothetical protein